MNKAEKEKFIRDLIETVSKSILDRVDKMPEGWDGWELRHYIAEAFAGVAWISMKDPARKKRYNNDVLINEL